MDWDSIEITLLLNALGEAQTALRAAIVSRDDCDRKIAKLRIEIVRDLIDSLIEEGV